jgi:DNA-binding MarR family transcriptional regulator
MKNPIANLNKVFDSRIRLGIMSALMVNESVHFNELKELIAVTDGNLASHLRTLEESGYLKVQKGFIGRKTQTSYSVTKAGEKAFRQHLEALEDMIRAME